MEPAKKRLTKTSLSYGKLNHSRYPRIVEFDTLSGDHYRVEPCCAYHFAVYTHKRGAFVLLGTIRFVGKLYPSTLMEQIKKEIETDLRIKGNLRQIKIKGDKWQKEYIVPLNRKECF